MLQNLRPHDLLWLKPTAMLAGGDADFVVPDWVDPQWPVVVRRAISQGQLPVGLRGPLRSQRCAALVGPQAVQRSVTPEFLQQSQCWLLQPVLASDAPVVLLVQLHTLLQHLGLDWGPTGSVGFALATGYPVLRRESDLDLVVRAPHPLTAQQIMLLQQVLDKQSPHSCRIDLQIDTGHGGFAFSEWLRASGKILLKTNAGPVLTDHPWA